jgi:hypothetical protein
MQVCPWKIARLAVAQEFPQYFMESEGSLPCSQEPSIDPYPKPGESGAYNPVLSL